MKRYLPILVAGVIFSAVFSACSSSGNSAAPQKISAGLAPREKSARSVKLLAHHDTNAVFAGTHNRRCMGMTTLCPDKCGNSGTVAVFNIESYNDYDKRDKYGDAKAETFVFMLESTTGTSDVSPEIASFVRALEKGEKVRLVWDHVYVTDQNGSRFPLRPIREISHE